MNVSLTPELEKYVNDKVKTGRYNSASEVMRESLRALQNDELRREILLGVEDIRKGRSIVLQTEEDFRNFAEDIKTRGRARLNAKHQGLDANPSV